MSLSSFQFCFVLDFTLLYSLEMNIISGILLCDFTSAQILIGPCVCSPWFLRLLIDFNLFKRQVTEDFWAEAHISHYSMRKMLMTLISQTHRIKINYSMFPQEMVKRIGRSGWNCIPSNWWSVFINRVPSLHSLSLVFLIVPLMILVLLLILVYCQTVAVMERKK